MDYITIKEDLVRESAVTSTCNEQTLTRGFLVSGLTDPADEQPLVAEAAVDSVSGFAIPALFAGHPAKPEAIVTRINVKALGAGSFYVTCTYTYKILPSQYLQSFRAGFRQVPTHYDATDALAVVTYTPAAGAAIKQVAALTRARVTATLSFELVEQTSPEASTTALAGNTNSDIWRGYAAGTLLVLPISGETRDGVNYRNTYSFSYDPMTWDEYAFYQDPSTGRVPPDVAATVVTDGSATSGNGWGRFVVYPKITFATSFPQLPA